MPDIFNRFTDTFGGSFSADQGFITFPAILNSQGQNIGADVGLLIQRMAMTYSQEVARLYEVGHSAIYYIGGRTNGMIGLDRVVGPRTISQAFYRTYGDICRARTNTLAFTVFNGCGDTGTSQTQSNSANLGFVEYIAHFCVITTIGVNVRAQDMIINEALQIMFSSLLYSSDINQSADSLAA